MLWASHLLIRYDGVQDAESIPFKLADFHSVPAPSRRSREEALSLARELAQRLREKPERFAELAHEYSEDLVRRERGASLGGIPATQLSAWPEVLDALTALAPGEVGDFGTWINRELTPVPSEVEVLNQLDVGEVAAPFDSVFGIELVLCVPNPERASYAMEGIALYFDPAAADSDPKPQTKVQAEARRLSEELRPVAARHTVAAVRAVSRPVAGRVRLARVDRSAARGCGRRRAARPHRSGLFFVVGRRIAPRAEAPTAALINLPVQLSSALRAQPAAR